MSIAHFGFLAIFTLYLVLLLAEYLRPGFVATNGNVHWLWVIMVLWVAMDWVLGIGNRRLGVGRTTAAGALVVERVLSEGDRDEDSVSLLGRILSLLSLFVFGIILGLIVWRLGEAFGGMRLLFAFAAAVAPLFLVKSVTTD